MLLSRTRLLVAAATVAVALLATAGSAMAATYTVDSTLDTPDADAASGLFDGSCDDGAGHCTLRAAIQEANHCLPTPTGCVADTIGFANAPFDGTTANGTITLGSNLPAITDQVNIDGGHCSGSADSEPCAGITGTGTRSISALQVASGAAGSTIENLAFWNLNAGVFLLGTVTHLQGSWFGIDLDESTASASNNDGVVISDGVSNTVGGTTADTRNLFAQNVTAGVLIQGGDSNAVSGNYFGTNRAGTAPIAGFSNGDAIAIFGIAGTPNDDATGNDIGGFHSSTSCDGSCNLIANSSDDGIDLSNQGSSGLLAADRTTIEGNYIGLQLNGTVGYGGGTGATHRGIDLGSSSAASSTVVGGSAANARNYLGGFPVGIDTGQETGTTVIRNNYFNAQPDGTGGLPSSKLLQGIAVSSASGPGNLTSVLDNRFGGSGGAAASDVGIESYGNGRAQIKRNLLGVDSAGADLPSFAAYAISIDSPSNQIGSSSSVDGNTIANGASGGVHVNGSSGNLIQGNFIGTDSTWTEDHSNGGPGVLVDGTPDTALTTVIGDTTSAGVNVISNNGGDAVRVSRIDGVDIERNTGSGNGQQFIDLENPSGAGNNLADGAAEGLQAPVITNFSSTTQASGTAQPNATIRLYLKSSASAGELGTQLASVVANGAGNWNATFGALSEGQRLAATQTVLESFSPFLPETSELSPVVQLDLVAPPKPTISGTSPGSPSNVDQPAVKGSAEAGSTVKLYAGSDCSGSVIGSGTAAQFAGSGIAPTDAIAHDTLTTFHVTATDVAGNASTCSDGFDYTEDSSPPDLVIDTAPSSFSNDDTPSVAFHATDAHGPVSLKCTLTGGSPSSCSSPQGYGPLVDGDYTITVDATDAIGNTTSEPIDFTIDTIAPVTVIDSAPSGTTNDDTPTVSFHTDDVNGASFACKVDSGSFSPCSSAATFGPLGDGAHTISVLATDLAGNVEDSPKSASFTVAVPTSSMPPGSGPGSKGPGSGSGSGAAGKKCKKKKKKGRAAAAAKKCKKKKKKRR